MAQPPLVFPVPEKEPAVVVTNQRLEGIVMEYTPLESVEVDWSARIE